MDAAETAQFPQDLLSQVDRAGARAPAAQQDCQQLSVAECPYPFLQQTLTRAVIFRQIFNQRLGRSSDMPQFYPFPHVIIVSIKETIHAHR